MLQRVTSYAEVWIEIAGAGRFHDSCEVTSYAEVWIEILIYAVFERFLLVTSYAEVWIEMKVNIIRMRRMDRHLLRGGVD